MTLASASLTVMLPRPDGSLTEHVLGEPVAWQRPRHPALTREAISAVHVVPAPPTTDAGVRPELDWDATLAIRRHHWSWGLGVAEAMDTAQRGGALGWPLALELIQRSAREAASVGGRIVAGVATDSLPVDAPVDLPGVTRAYLEQLHAVEDAGAEPVIMASRHLCRLAQAPEDYLSAYAAVLAGSTRPVLLHWLGEAFDPELRGYWGEADPWAAAEVVLELVAAHPGAIDGIKLSVLDEALERDLRQRLPDGVRMYTGDDLHYPQLIRGDDGGHSDALLGVLDAIAPAAANALAALDRGEIETFDAILGSTLELGRILFEPPTHHYKAGIVFLAWLNGQQEQFRLLGGLESARSPEHLARVLVAADRAGLLAQPDLVARRWAELLASGGAG